MARWRRRADFATGFLGGFLGTLIGLAVIWPA